MFSDRARPAVNLKPGGRSGGVCRLKESKSVSGALLDHEEKFMKPDWLADESHSCADVVMINKPKVGE